MKKSQSTAAVLLIAILAFDFLLPTTPVAAAGQAPTGQAVTPTAEQSAALKKAKADMDAIAAQIDQFLKDHTQDAAGTPPPNAPTAEQAAALKKAEADMDASAAEINKFVSDTAQDAASAPETTPQVSGRFGSRSPRKCTDVASLPTSTQAAALVQCTMDYESPQQANLHQDITVQLGSPRHPTDFDRWPGIDPRFPVMDFAANATVYVCGPVLEAVMHNTGSNCDRYRYQSAPGVCWKTIDGSYRCQINAGLPTNPVRGQSPPTTY